jgi:hypothetical protein
MLYVMLGVLGLSAFSIAVAIKASVIDVSIAQTTYLVSNSLFSAE